MKKKWILIAGIFLAAAVTGGLVWKFTAGSSAPAAGENALYADSVGMLTGTGLGAANRFSGIVESQKVLNIKLDQNQTVKEIFVEKGQSVEAGTPLFQYDTEDLAMKLEQANLELEGISNNISVKNAQIDELTKAKQSAPESEQLSYTTQIQEAQLAVKQEEYNYKVKQLEIDKLQNSLDSSQVTSTIAGVVQEINRESSYDEYTGEQKPFMSILAVGKYRIKGTISEQNMADIYTGMPVTVHSRVDEDITWSGTIDSIDTEQPLSGMNSYSSDGSGIDGPASRYPFYVTLDSSDGLMLGQHVYLEEDSGQARDGMWLMSPYIIQEDGGSYVWAAGQDGTLEKRPVTLGAYDEEMDTYEILDGLESSDHIVWPSEDCREGAAVYINGEGPGEPSEEVPVDAFGA